MMKSVIVAALFAAVANSISIPTEWQSRVDSHNAFFADDDTGALKVNGYPEIYLPLIGNGYLSQEKGVRSDTMFVSGVFNDETTSPSHRARIPALFDVVVSNSASLGVLSDVQAGTYHRRGTLGNDKSWYELRWYAHRSLRSLYVMELEIHVDSASKFAELNFVDHLDSASKDFDMSAAVNNKLHTEMCGDTKVPETPDGQTHHVCTISSIVPHHIVVEQKDSGVVHTFLTATRTSLDVTGSGDIVTAARDDFHSGQKLAAASQLHSAHVLAWNQLWRSGVEIEGRPDVAAAINASLYAILSSVRDDWAYGLAPGGLTNYYNGHSFWDTETWMYPPLLYLHPSISQSLLMYRFNRLDGARKKAASYSPAFNGTMFPWESAFSGVETCPTFAATGLRENHISGDIAYAVWQEWSIRQDKKWLATIGYPILTGVADFWVSSATYTSSGTDNSRVAHINDIIPPDEYVDHVNDSVYTNFIAAQSLRFVVQASEILGEPCTSCATYSRLAEELVILFDTTLGIHPEYEGYPGNLVKQADVVLLHYPLGMDMSTDVQRADLEFYSEKTDHNGPAMTWGMHAVGFLDLQDFQNAGKFFNMSFQDNLHAPLQVWTETPDGNACNFITGAGGFLQTVTAGYPGLRLTYGALHMSPVCPEGASYMKIRSFSYLGNDLDLEFWCDVHASNEQLRMYPSKLAITQKGTSAVGTGTATPLRLTGLDVNVAVAVGAATVVTVPVPAVGSKPTTFQLKMA